MNQIEQEIKHSMEKGVSYADEIRKRADGGFKNIGNAVSVFWHEHSLEYQPGLGYIQIQHPSLMDRLLDRLLGGSRSIPRVVRRLPLK